MPAGIYEGRPLGVGTKNRQHVRSYRTEPCPNFDMLGRCETGAYLLGCGANFSLALHGGARIESNALHRAAANGNCSPRHDVAAWSIRDVPERGRRIRHQLAARWLDG